jgi:hypothetical protein
LQLSRPDIAAWGELPCNNLVCKADMGLRH